MPPVRKVKPNQPPKQPKAVERKAVSGQIEKKIKRQEKIRQKKVERERGVVFIKHLPHGFFEEQMKNYFEQFGKVTRLRLARSKRTGGSKGFAFVEFEYPEVAQVAAETMDNYLMFKKVVKASYIPPEKQRFNYFKTSLRQVKDKVGKQIYVASKTVAKRRKINQYNAWTDDAVQKRTQSKLNKVKELNAKYAHLGIDFSSIIVVPKERKVEVKAELSPEEAADGGNKRKTRSKVSATPQQSQAKQVKNEAELKDLLGDTINDDSDDEDWALTNSGDESDDDDEVVSSDEETYGFSKDSDEEVASQPKQIKQTFGKSLKPPKMNRLEQLIKRKTNEGGIKKAKKAAVKKAPITKSKNAAQVIAAKELLKTQPAIKSKITKKNPAKKQKVKN